MDRPANKLDTEVQFLKGIGPKAAPTLNKLGLFTVRDVLWYMPRRYDDRRKTPPLGQLTPGQWVTVRGRVIDVEGRPTRGGKVVLRALLSDQTGFLSLIWFNQPWIKKKLEKYRRELVAYGQIKEGMHGMEIASPEFELVEDEGDHDEFAQIVPVYGLSEGVYQKTVRRAVRSALDFYLEHVEDPLPSSLTKRYNLRPLRWSLQQMHQPMDDAAREEAHRRLALEEFLYLQLALMLRRREAKQDVGIAFPISLLTGGAAPAGAGPTNSLFGVEPLRHGESLWDEVRRLLPFELTGAQRRVIQEIWDDMERPAPMNRLVQGDVGSGKTAVAACAMLAAVRCGYQAALMAPTEVLAEQHAINLHRLFDPLGITVTLLAGKLTARQKAKARELVESGAVHIAVGTHALVEEGVRFRKLGLAIIDEQHRFGVRQRAALRMKGAENPDVLVMTATPIPRTLTMAFYGDLDLSVIDELPPGRTPIRTHWKRPDERDSVYGAARKLIQDGRQAYVICPMIEDSDKMQAQAASDLFARLGAGAFHGLRVGLLHGQMKSKEKEDVMERFRAGDLDVLVSTVVVEVGVDVPNATVMIIEDANRFGLAQLHQLRGRVGRGRHRSFCVLIADGRTEEAERRLEILVETTDGFKIAEEDLRLRGPGDLVGTRQSGNLDLHFADLIRDAKLLEEARQIALKILDVDPELRLPEFQPMLERVRGARTETAVIAVS